MGRSHVLPKAFHLGSYCFTYSTISYSICAVAEIKNNCNEFDVGWLPINILKS